MAFILNEDDVALALERAQAPTRNDRPNLLKAAAILARLVQWTNENSDGWPYWQRPADASTNLQQAVRVRTAGLIHHAALRDDDIPDAEMTRSLRTVKAFLTRHAVPRDVKARILGEER